MSPDTTAQTLAGVIEAVGQYIKAQGPIPSGHLYARLLGFMELDTYEALIGVLVSAGKVRRHRNHLLEWVGPQPTTLGSQETNNKETKQ